MSEYYTNPLVSIIILNYNGEEYLDDCLSSVMGQSYPNMEIIFVDNCSTDRSVDFVKKNFKSVKVIKNSGNFGFAKGNNVGIVNAKGEYIVTLNPDTVVEPNWLSELVEVMEGDDNIGASMSKILLFDRKNIINTDGNLINFLGFGWVGNYGKKDDGNKKIKEIPCPSGAAMILRRETLNDVGLFDENFFLYLEDHDLGLRMRLAKYRILCIPKSVVYHKYSFSKNEDKFIHYERNRIMILLKTFEMKTLILIIPAFLIVELSVIFRALREGWLLRKLDTYRYILRNMHNILIGRKNIQEHRKIKDKELLEFFEGAINFEELQSPILQKVGNPFLSLYFRVMKKIV